ncbi:MAG: hypothetical protein IPI46_05700 [Bacteroidetes bacterium]|nr:hypothetical protein [Bacteroidota bacterium]
MKHLLSLLCLILANSFITQAQVLTAEDSLANGIIAAKVRTVISGYGEASVKYDLKNHEGEATLKRIVLFIGHKFSNRVSLFTEMELEHGLVVGGEEKGEIAMEQAFLKFDINSSNYFVAGLFIPRIGIINENHLPTTYHGVERPWVERLVIPATWREIGIGYYGNSRKLNGLNYSVALMNGLNSEGFENGTGIRGGRQEGSKAKLAGLALNASLLYYFKNFRLQTSAYVGGSSAVNPVVADSISLNHGLLANPVFLNEINLQYRDDRFALKFLACIINIPHAGNINRAFANNTPNRIFGSHFELAYDILPEKYRTDGRGLFLFSRAEFLDLNQRIAENGVSNQGNKKTFLLAGLTYKPIRGAVLKFDYTHVMSGQRNEALVNTSGYYSANGIVNLGIGYNF